MFWQWLSRHFFCFGAGYNCDHDCFFGTDVLIADKPIACPLAKPHPAWSSCFDTVLLPLQACLPSDSFCLYAARDGLPAEYKFSINREVVNCKRACFSSRQIVFQVLGNKFGLVFFSRGRWVTFLSEFPTCGDTIESALVKDGSGKTPTAVLSSLEVIQLQRIQPD